MKKYAIIVAVTAACILAGCGLYDREYININEYKPAEVSARSEETVTVKTIIQLKNVIRDLVYNEQTEGTVRFDPSYEGDPESDIQSACMELRLNDALCAYSEVKFTFRLTPIVNYSEAVITVSYSDTSEPISNIIYLPYSVGVEEHITKALDSNSERMVVLISASNYSSLEMRALVSSVFRRSPTICPVEPDVNVYMYSGEDNQRLYEIIFKYSLSEDELIRRKSLIKNLNITKDINAEDLDELHKVYALCRYFDVNCDADGSEEQNTLYDAMIMHRANSEGIALAFVESAHRLGLQAEIVYGQRNGQDCCWNIVEIEGQRYHIDICRFMSEGILEGFIKNDEAMNENYRWDGSVYERCTGRLSFINLPEYLPEDYVIIPEEDSEVVPGDEDGFAGIVVGEVIENTPQPQEEGTAEELPAAEENSDEATQSEPTEENASGGT